MMNVKIPLAGIPESVVRPVAAAVVRDLKSMLNLDKDIWTITKNSVDSFLDGSNTTGSSTDTSYSSPKTESVKVTLEEDYNENSILSTRISKLDAYPILNDPELGLLIKPVYMDSILSFKFSYFSKSKTNILRVLNSLRLKVVENAELALHTLDYGYVVPRSVLLLVHDINELRNVHAKIGYNLEDYMIHIADTRVTTINGRSGKAIKVEVAVKENQLQVIGVFKTPLANIKEEYDSDKKGWTAEFTYQVTYNKPIYLHASYPVVVYNQVLPDKYLQNIRSVKDIKNLEANRSVLGNATKPFLLEQMLYRSLPDNSNIAKPWYYVKIPDYDTFLAPTPKPYMVRVFTALTLITFDDKRNLLNLNDLSTYKLDPTVLDFMTTSEFSSMNTAYDSIFHIEVFENNFPIKQENIEIDSMLNVYSKIDLDLSKTYRVSLSVTIDLDVLMTDAKNRALNNEVVQSQTLELLGFVDGLDPTVQTPNLVNIKTPSPMEYSTGLRVIVTTAYLAET